jgi:integrase
MHDLRHYYASLLIRHGESVKTVQRRLGHATAAETLDTYSHLWPDSDDRTREARGHDLDGRAPGAPESKSG